eukprot:Nitzschia sp. Nitz4//scaffold241_size29735//22372//22797//NITZ4_008030-RA/size29735-processed-gene-0.7-mRNA-1//1//CDS//3329543787//705//frame0
MLSLPTLTPRRTNTDTTVELSPPLLKRKRSFDASPATPSIVEENAPLPSALFLPSDLDNTSEVDNDRLPEISLRPRSSRWSMASLEMPFSRRIPIMPEFDLSNDLAQVAPVPDRKRRRASISSCSVDTISALGSPSMTGCV